MQPVSSANFRHFPISKDTRLSLLFCNESDGRLGRAWEQMAHLVLTRVFPQPAATAAMHCHLEGDTHHLPFLLPYLDMMPQAICSEYA